MIIRQSEWDERIICVSELKIVLRMVLWLYIWGPLFTIVKWCFTDSALTLYLPKEEERAWFCVQTLRRFLAFIDLLLHMCKWKNWKTIS